MLKMNNKFCYSGGAYGSDYLFDCLGNEFGYKTVIWSFKGHNRILTNNSIIKELSQVELNTKSLLLSDVRKILKKRISNSQYINNLMLRNAFQITGIKKETELVIAISTITNNKVDGGTGYAVEIAKLYHKPIIVIDKNDLNLFIFNYQENIFENVDLFKVKKMLSNVNIFTGIGSRDINVDKIKKILRLIFSEVNND